MRSFAVQLGSSASKGIACRMSLTSVKVFFISCATMITHVQGGMRVAMYSQVARRPPVIASLLQALFFAPGIV